MVKIASQLWMRPWLRQVGLGGTALLLSCQGTDMPIVDELPPGPCQAQGITEKSRFPSGDATGHRDPLGAKAAKQARAGRITDPAWIRQPESARHPVREGDFLLINDKIAAYIEAKGVSDGYQPFGGEILALDAVAADGKPAGKSLYGETIMALSRQVLSPDSVTVLSDGSDGKAAVIRASGVLKNLPFLEFLGGVLNEEFNFPIAFDYILEPGAESVKLRIHLMNIHAEDLPLYRHQLFVLFHTSRSQMFSASRGYGDLDGDQDWVGFDSGDSSFALRPLSGPFTPLLGRSGSVIIQGSGLNVKACETLSTDYVEFIVGGPHSDGLGESLRRVLKQPAWRAVTGTVQDGATAVQAGAWVHAVKPDGTYLGRTKTSERGEFTIHLPSEPVQLIATQYAQPPSTPKTALPTDTQASLRLDTVGTLSVTATDKGSGVALPVRVQVIPMTPPQAVPRSYGVRDENNGRIIQEFAVTGSTKLAVPPGKHRVVVSRGYEWEILDQTVTIESGKTAEVKAELLHSIDSTGVMCADFHIHTYHSADSSDDVEYKVKGAIADGLEIPVSSEHEYIIDFQPFIQKLGLTRWAFGVPSEEFTTFAWGHFGVIPIRPRPSEPNRGAVQWYGKKPPEVFHNIAQLPENPVLIVNHPRSDSFGGYLTSVSFDRETVSGDPDLYSEEYGALEVFNDSDFDDNRSKIVLDWFALLNSGKRMWAVGSSDSHGLRTSPTGYPRTCLSFGHDDPTRLSPELLRDALRAGKATISGGLYLTVRGPDGESPGGEIRSAGGPVTLQVTVQSPKWLAAKRLETIVDGETVATEELRETVTPQGRRYDATVTVRGKAGRPRHWVVFHASSGGADLSPVHPGRKAFAVSNPIFF
jgi:hypothetical protein